MTPLAGRVAIVTGGARGLGRVFAGALSAAGAQVVIADVADGSEAADAIGGHYLHTDVSDAAAVEACVSATMDLQGRIDVLVNNAALYAALPMVRYDAIDPDLWDRVMAVNLRGAFLMIRATGPRMEAAGYGRIVNVTSGTVLKGMPGMLHYIASKGGLAAMTRALSRELGAAGITVNSLAPGLTLSDSILGNTAHLDAARDRVIASRAIRRDGMPEDLVGALVFLCSDAAAFMTGQTLLVDGGSGNT